MNHWLIAPVLLPLATGIALIALTRHDLRVQRALSVGATIALVFIAMFYWLWRVRGRRHLAREVVDQVPT